jgi:hypothetical protein
MENMEEHECIKVCVTNEEFDGEFLTGFTVI